jgi:hypothetical protein
MRKAGINPDDWHPERGFEITQRGIVRKVYNYYQSIYERNNNFQWAGMARLAGGSVVRGLEQIDKDRYLKVGHPTGLIEEFGLASVRDISYVIETILQTMQKSIFMDIGWVHEAYLEGGISALNTLQKNGQLNPEIYKAFVAIDDGITHKNDDEIWAGNLALLLREQQFVLGPSYSQLHDIPFTAAAMTKNVANPIPGGGPFTGTDITDFTQRWPWIYSQMYHPWRELTQQQRNALVGQSYHQLTGEPNLTSTTQP